MKAVRVLTCEEKDWDFNGKQGKYYPCEVRIDSKIFAINSKVSLKEYIDKDVDLEFEFQSKTQGQGNKQRSYVTVRVTGVAGKILK